MSNLIYATGNALFRTMVIVLAFLDLSAGFFFEHHGIPHTIDLFPSPDTVRSFGSPIPVTIVDLCFYVGLTAVHVVMMLIFFNRLRRNHRIYKPFFASLIPGEIH